jgi:hypothetical protein
VHDRDFDLRSLKFRDLLPLWSGFAPILSRELPFAIAKFVTFDLIATTSIAFLNSQTVDGSLPIQVGVGPIGLAVSAGAGSIAGIGEYRFRMRKFGSRFHLNAKFLPFSWRICFASSRFDPDEDLGQ